MGYARVSTEDQNLDVQLAALRSAGAEMLFVEKISAVSLKRPRFNLMLKFAERGDTILFHSLSRMWREAEKVIAMLRQLTAAGIIWRSLTEPHLDGTTAIGRFMVTMTAAKDQLERDQIIERTIRGMQERKRQGMALGRKALISPTQAREMVALRRRKVKVSVIARRFKVKQSTVYARTNALMRAKKSKR